MMRHLIDKIMTEYGWNNFFSKWYMWKMYKKDCVLFAHVGGYDMDHLMVSIHKKDGPEFSNDGDWIKVPGTESSSIMNETDLKLTLQHINDNLC